MKILKYLLCLLFMIPSSGFAATYYIAQSAAGSGDASSCANARVYTWNWTTGSSVTGGDTVYICGTITGSAAYNSTGLTIPKSGTSAELPITVKFCKDGEANCGTKETTQCTATNRLGDACFSSAYWANTGAIYSPSRQYITIDGNSVGIVENTDCGVEKTYQGYLSGGTYLSNGIYINGGSNIEVQGTIIRNLYIPVFGVNPDYPTSATAIKIISPSTLSVHNNTISYAATGISASWSSAGHWSGADLYSNTISLCNWGMSIAGGANKSLNSMTNMKIHDNDIEVGVGFFPALYYHHNGIIGWSTSSNPAEMINLQIYNNYLHGPSSVPDGYDVNTSSLGTGFIFLQSLYLTNTHIYNNVMAGIIDDIGSSMIHMDYDRDSSVEIYNNTMAGAGIAGTGASGRCVGYMTYGTSSIVYKNNICTGIPEGDHSSLWIAPQSGGTTTITVDNNIYYSPLASYVAKGSTSAERYNFTAWKSYLGGCPGTDNDCNSLTSDPLYTSTTDFTLQTGSPALNIGADLSAIFTTDKLGTTRPTGAGTWDSGAYEKTGEDATAPTVLSATIQSNGTDIVFLLSEAITAADDAAFTVDPSGADVTVDCPAVASATNTMTCVISRAILQVETATYGYTGTKVEDTSANDLATISSSPLVINQSIQVSPPTYDLTITKGTGASYVYTSDFLINCGSDCTETYDGDTIITIGASCLANYSGVTFSGTGCGASTTMSEARSCTVGCSKIAADSKVGSGNPGHRVGAGNPAHKRY